MIEKLDITNKEMSKETILNIESKINEVIDKVNMISSKINCLDSITTRVGKTEIKTAIDGIKCSVAKIDDLIVKGSKIDSSFELKKQKELSDSSVNYSSIEVGKLTDEEMIRFNLGPYSNKKTF